MLQRNRRDERINGRQAHALAAPQPENRRRFPVRPEPTRLSTTTNLSVMNHL
jgi:hypothetical protein